MKTAVELIDEMVGEGKGNSGQFVAAAKKAGATIQKSGKDTIAVFKKPADVQLFMRDEVPRRGVDGVDFKPRGKKLLIKQLSR